MGGPFRRLFRRAFRSKQAFDFFVGNRIEIDCTGRFGRGDRWRWRWLGGRRSAEVAGNQGRDLTDGPRPHQTRGREGDSDRRFERCFDFDAHERIQSKIGQQLRAMYDGVVDEGVPDRFAELLRQMDKPADGDK